ncbi:MAG: insulinase family protein [Bifidobacteriaceae bacterium]|jgi:predicted Zn-dependent peptidase|nr:insulinase family protein [Bifidobacteriaceae bacterium]
MTDGGAAPGAEGAELQGSAGIRRSVLPGGVRLVTERMDSARSATIGVWVPVGSRDEANGHFGSTHFLEHLLFKGTGRRTAMDIAAAFDQVGGEANAATSKEHTCYFARVLDADQPMALDVLMDMVTSAAIDPGEFETERGVILEELAMTEDDPHEVAHEAFDAVVYGESSLARPIGGTPAAIRSVTRDAVWEHYREHYRRDNLVVTAAGNVDHQSLAALLEAALAAGGWGAEDGGAGGETPAAARRRPTSSSVALPAEGSERRLVRPVEQAQILIGCEGLRAMDERRHAMGVLNAVLGGGMSSRLFQEIRERRGLAYSTYSFAGGHADAGSFGVYAGCAPAVAEQVAELLEAQWDQLARGGITDGELDRAKGQLSGNLVLGMEDSYSRMARLGRAEILSGELPTVEELLARVRAVTSGEVAGLAQDLASRPRSRVWMTPAA